MGQLLEHWPISSSMAVSGSTNKSNHILDPEILPTGTQLHILNTPALAISHERLVTPKPEAAPSQAVAEAPQPHAVAEAPQPKAIPSLAIIATIQRETTEDED